MALHPDPIGPVPEETRRVAQAVFRKGNLCLRLRETLGTIYEDELFADLFSPTGRPAEAPWRLALVSVLQFVEDLSDRQAAEAVRARIDWKYLLGLELTDPGFDYTLLTDFRARLLEKEADRRLFEHRLAALCQIELRRRAACNKDEFAFRTVGSFSYLIQEHSYVFE